MPPSTGQGLAPPTGGSKSEGGIEEGRGSYKPGGLHPVYIGDIYAEKYEVLSKIGYGVYSTVWLVKDLTKPEGDDHRFRALKVLSADCYGEDYPIFEREILKYLRDDGDKEDLGYAYICHLVDDFEHQGPNGTHVCLVFELMGENLRSFPCWFKGDQIPYLIIRRFAIQLLLALDYAHRCGIIHTDIKADNIFVKFRDTSRIESGYLVKSQIPKQDRAEEAYTPIQSIPLRLFYFNDEDSTKIDQFDIALGDWGVASWATKHLTENIQPIALRAPEVLIKAPWDATVDWWNLGAILLELYPAVRMFDGRVPPDGHYELGMHIAEIVDLFGPFPKELLEKGDQNIVRDIFDDEGKPKDFGPLDRPPLESELFMPEMKDKYREEFASFLRAIMKINPADRLSTDDLLRHPWLDAMK
ncbi:kinase-like domain-containing protein [Cercophora newfieldiana]|uniref:non-specific serine/threonine protein kinase n=1 Tax=Cercophora newfieldiana TaxID=92897 RepID=A0AA39YDN1_9PEZI|nr:kinase-like domain-containing protein [Cercophora newfieldiana]